MRERWLENSSWEKKKREHFLPPCLLNHIARQGQRAGAHGRGGGEGKRGECQLSEHVALMPSCGREPKGEHAGWEGGGQNPLQEEKHYELNHGSLQESAWAGNRGLHFKKIFFGEGFQGQRQKETWVCCPAGIQLCPL